MFSIMSLECKGSYFMSELGCTIHTHTLIKLIHSEAKFLHETPKVPPKENIEETLIATI